MFMSWWAGTITWIILLMGAFNLSNATDWKSFPLDVDASSRHVIDLAASHELRHLNKVKNQRGVILDLVLSGISSTKVVPAIDLVLSEDTHHLALHYRYIILYFPISCCSQRQICTGLSKL